jgi:hypothetical protein
MRVKAQYVAIERGRRIKVGHGNPDMSNPGRIRHERLLAEVVEPGGIPRLHSFSEPAGDGQHQIGE